MTQTTPDPTDRAQTAPPTQGKRHPWHWIIPCVVLAAAAIGLGIWALSLRSDLNDQKSANATLQHENAATKEDLESVSSQVDSLEQTVNTVSQELSQQGANTQKAVEDAIASAQNTLKSLQTKAHDAVSKITEAAKSANQGG
jgi:septal ring factor EnvC (AmiA/AmiB activator)